MKLKTIRIYPSEWDLDVIVGGTKKDLENISKKRYGLTYDFPVHNECTSIDSSKDSELKGRRGVVIILKSFNKAIIVHEIIHAIWHLSMYIGLEICYESNEWQALLAEYLFDEITNKEGYKTYDS